MSQRTFAGGWNHRVIRSTHEIEPFPPEEMFAIHEVYYDEAGTPSSWTAEPISIAGDTWKEAAEAWMRMQRAFELPALEVVGGRLVELEVHDGV